MEERARRERARMTLSGITDYALARDGSSVLISQADQLARITLPDDAVHPLPGAGWIAPRLSPDGRFVAAVRANDLHVLDTQTGADRQLTQGGTDTLSHGLAEFAAAEELGRADGAWWSPDGGTLLYEESDTSGVEPHFNRRPGPSRAPAGGLPLPARRHRQRAPPSRPGAARRRPDPLARLGQRRLPLPRARRVAR